jgi:hypothetical protein
MVEVFRTDVTQAHHADWIVDQIHRNFGNYTANFDLDDCDHILRVKSADGFVQPSCLIDLLKDLGFSAQVLEDNQEIDHLWEDLKDVKS